MAPVGWPNIDNDTCLLTLPVALRRSQYQAMAEPLQGSRRSCKTPQCHRHNNTQKYHHLHCPPCQRRQKLKSLLVNNTQECSKGQNWSCLCTFCLHNALGRRRDHSWQHPFPSFIVMSLYCLHCTPCQKRQKRKTLTDIIIHKCNSDHPKSCLQNFHPHNAQQRSAELGKPNGWECWAATDDGGVRIEGSGALQRVAISKSRLQKCHPHHRRQWSAELGISNKWECWAAADNGGVRIKGTRALRRVAILKSRLKNFHPHKRSSEAQNSVNPMGGNVGLPLAMVLSGLKVPRHCGGWQYC